MRRERQPIVFALWHGDLLPLLYQHRNEGVSVLISEHRDGELIARVAESLGFRTVRGSSSRGASRALVGLTRELTSGHDVAITPDGPRGPARSFAPGALIAAQRGNGAVIAVGLAAKSAWRLRSWDRFVIPIAPGALIAAQRGNGAVIAVGLAAKSAWRLRSWDRFVIPKPFSSLRIAYSDPVMVDATDARAAAEETPRFQALLMEMERLANA
jgi:lysophospholipid acyltransferase (LPLAT)-like uncharacterized protein